MTPAAPLARQLRELPRSERRAALQAAVSAEVRRALLMSADDELPLDANYFDLGLTSLRIVEIKEGLEAGLGCEIDGSVLFGRPTVEQLVAHLTGESLPGLFAARPAEERGEDNHEPGELLDELLLQRYEPVAIVGIGLRFPGGNDNPAGFAEFFRTGRSGIVPIPADRWDVRAFTSDDPYAKGTVRTAAGGFIDGIDQFDARFFAISPKEAQYVDPQQRIMLETAWEALEHANIDPTSLRHRDGGVYVGVSTMDYSNQLGALAHEDLDGRLGTGIAYSAVAGRLSYFLDLRGPSMSIDTACSSSLVALHLAVEGLRRRECEVALCGGVNVIHHPRNHIICSEANMLAPDGICKTFDDAADGYGRSEGCGVIVLKRLSDARRDGDRIIAQVRGVAVRQDGASGGLTVPDGSAQEAVMRAALAAARLEPGDIQYVEAHGTGTPLGDPIELAAIRGVFAGSHSTADPVMVGSHKTNVGHMEAAAGIGGVIKTALQLSEATIFPHLHLETPSRFIPWDSYPVVVPTQARPWQAGTRRALVNSFGFAGTIACAVLEQAPAGAGLSQAAAERAGVPAADDAHIFTLSAKSTNSLRRQVESYQRHLARHPGDDVRGICDTSNLGRAHFSLRLAGVVRGRDDLARLLDDQLARLEGGGDAPGEPPKVALLFAGQGSQYAGMGLPLYERFGVFREHVDSCDRLFAGYLSRSVRSFLLGTAGDGAAQEINKTLYAQPALFMLEYALAKLWLSWGIQPSVLAGHSIGEVAAAAIAGVFSLPDAVVLVAARARLMQSVAVPGGMFAVRAPAAEVAPLLAGHHDIAFAALNTPRQCVVSGGRESLAEVVSALAGRGVRTRELVTSHAFHSPLMTEVSGAFREAIADIRFHEPELTLISNLTGAVAEPADMCTPEYWARHITEPVDFVASMQTVQARGRHAFVEVGPAATLVGLGKQCVRAREHMWLTSLNPDDTDASVIRGAVTRLYAAGAGVSWAGYHQGQARTKVTLPTYAFDRRRYWLPVSGKARSADVVAGQESMRHPLLGAQTSTPGQLRSGIREFASQLTATRPAYLADHQVMGQVMFPAAGYVEMLLAALDIVYGEAGRPIWDLRIHEPLLLRDERPAEIRVRLRELPEGSASVEIVSRMDGNDHAIERRHVTAVLGAGPALVPSLADAGEAMRTMAAVAGGPDVELGADDFYAGLAGRGLEYGAHFRRLQLVARHGDDLAVGEQCGQIAATAEHLPPPILDCALQTVAGLRGAGQIYLPAGIACFQLLKKPRGERLRSLLRVTGADSADGTLSVDVTLLEGDRPVFVLQGLTLTPVARAATRPRRRIFHEPRWVRQPLLAGNTGRPRHVLVLGRPEAAFADLADRLTGTGTRLSWADNVAEAAGMMRQRPTDVCWFWQPRPAAAGEARVRAESEHNFRELLELLHALEPAGFGRDQRLWLVTEGAQYLADDAIGAGERLAATALWGFGQALWSEYPNYRVTMVDLPQGCVDHRQLLDEWLGTDSDEFQVAYRAGVRHVRRIQPSDLGESQAATVRPVTVGPDETYLVTGGLGALGLATAETLVGLGARHIALLSRRGVCAADLARLESRLGSDVRVTAYEGDVADARDLGRIAADLARRPQPLAGVVHAAGVLADTPVGAMTWEHIDTVFRSKVYGTWLLHEALASFPGLKFFVGYSSVTAVLGRPAQANYAAGNAFVDTMMRWRAAQGLPGLSVNWGPWAEIGMAAGLSGQRIKAIEDQGMKFLEPAEATRSLVRVLGRPLAQVMVGEFDWDRYAARQPAANALYRSVAGGRAGAGSREGTGGRVDLDALLAQPVAPRRAAIGELIRAKIVSLLDFDDADEVAANAMFAELGLDSLMAIELRTELESAFGVSLQTGMVLDYPSLELLAGFVDEQLVPTAAGNSPS